MRPVRVALALALLLALPAASPSAEPDSSADDCAFIADTRPRQYVAYRLADGQQLTLDGRLDDAAWAEVGWSEPFVDISEAATPPLRTQVKLRWDEEYLYVGARLEEPQVAANISTCCHCVNSSQDQVIFHDSDFEVFVDADGSTHNYKEMETNALHATWDLLLSRSYEDGGSENSSRLFGADGWDMMEPRGTGRAAAFTDGVMNDPQSKPSFWSVEIRLPLHKLAELTTARLPGDAAGESGPPLMWRINFSRVEVRHASLFSSDFPRFSDSLR